MEGKWKVVERNVAICPKCNGGCALWRNTETAEGIFTVVCDYCDYEKTIFIEQTKENKNGK